MKKLSLITLAVMFATFGYIQFAFGQDTATDTSSDSVDETEHMESVYPPQEYRNTMIERRMMYRDQASTTENDFIEMRQDRRDFMENQEEMMRERAEEIMEDHGEQMEERREEIEEHRDEMRQELQERRLERKTNVIKRMLARLDNAYERMVNIIGRINQASTTLSEAGIDTSLVVESLFTAENKLAEARSAIDAVHGYDASMDPETDTNRLEEFKGIVRTAVNTLKEAHSTLGSTIRIVKDLRPQDDDQQDDEGDAENPDENDEEDTSDADGEGDDTENNQ